MTSLFSHEVHSQLQIYMPVWNETFLCAGHVRQILVSVLLYSWLCAGHVRRTSLRFHTGIYALPWRRAFT